MTSRDCPKLRWPLETEPFEHVGIKYLVFRDPYGIAPEPALVPVPCVPIVARFDGMTSIEKIAEEGKDFGATVELVGRLADELERMNFLETADTGRRVSAMQSSFLDLAVRPAALAGSVYPDSPELLREEIRAYVGEAESTYSTGGKEKIVALMAPHIDYHRGRKTYGAGYSILEALERPDVIFLIGTSHAGGESMFQLSRKDFASPLGTLPAARDVIDDLSTRYGPERAFRDEFLHKREHSLELQLPFLAHRFADGPLPAIVPILVNSFHSFLLKGSSPLDDGETGDFIGALAEAARALRLSGKRVLFYDGVDLAHVGLHFGDEKAVGKKGLPEIEQRDRVLLDTVLAADEARLFGHMAEDLDKRRICGFPSLYTTLAALRLAGIQVEGRLVEYRQSLDPASDCIVTFASACWVERS